MTNSKVKGFLVERDGRALFMRELQAWTIEDVNYKVTPLISGLMEDREEPLVTGVPSLPSTDDTAERIELMNELFSLQDLEISQLKSQLEKFVEVVEGIVELTDVVSHSAIECRSKLIVIGDSCKALLKPSE